MTTPLKLSDLQQMTQLAIEHNEQVVTEEELNAYIGGLNIQDAQTGVQNAANNGKYDCSITFSIPERIVQALHLPKLSNSSFEDWAEIHEEAKYIRDLVTRIGEVRITDVDYRCSKTESIEFLLRVKVTWRPTE